MLHQVKMEKVSSKWSETGTQTQNNRDDEWVLLTNHQAPQSFLFKIDCYILGRPATSFLAPC